MRSLFADFAETVAPELVAALGGGGPVSLEAKTFRPSAPELSVLHALHHRGQVVSLVWPSWGPDGPRALDPDDGRVERWQRAHVDAVQDPDEREALVYRLTEAKIQLRLLNRMLGDREDEGKARAAVRRLAKKLGVPADPLLVVPPWHVKVEGTSSRRKRARAYTEGAASSAVVERLIAAQGLLETATALRMDAVRPSIAEMAPALTVLGADEVGYVRLMAWEAAEQLVRTALYKGEAAAAEPLMALLGSVPVDPVRAMDPSSTYFSTMAEAGRSIHPWCMARALANAGDYATVVGVTAALYLGGKMHAGVEMVEAAEAAGGLRDDALLNAGLLYAATGNAAKARAMAERAAQAGDESAPMLEPAAQVAEGDLAGALATLAALKSAGQPGFHGWRDDVVFAPLAADPAFAMLFS